MNLIARFTVAGSFTLLQVYVAAGQVREWNNSSLVSTHYEVPNPGNIITKTRIPGLHEDRQSDFKPAVPVLSLPPAATSFAGDTFWVGSITTQSYNRGKIGRYYYWDVLGNLQGSHLFVDIAGKGKRGLKLVFPRQRTTF